MSTWLTLAPNTPPGATLANAVCFSPALVGGTMKPITIATLVLAFAPAVVAQTMAPNTSNPVVSTVRQLEERQSKNLIGAAEEMPADKYSYHPTPEQMTFAHLVIHVTEANNGMCARVAGDQPRETKLSEADSKEMLTKAERFVRLLRAGAGQG